MQTRQYKGPVTHRAACGAINEPNWPDIVERKAASWRLPRWVGTAILSYPLPHNLPLSVGSALPPGRSWCDRCGPFGSSMLKAAGRRRRHLSRACHRNAAQIFAILPQDEGRAICGSAIHFGLVSALRGRNRGCIVWEFGTSHAQCGKVAAEQVARFRISIGERSSIRRRHCPRGRLLSVFPEVFSRVFAD